MNGSLLCVFLLSVRMVLKVGNKKNMLGFSRSCNIEPVVIAARDLIGTGTTLNILGTDAFALLNRIY